MNITEANDLNVLLRYLLGLSPLPNDDEARGAAERLAAKANKTLAAGLTSERVAAAWPEVLVCPAADHADRAWKVKA